MTQNARSYETNSQRKERLKIENLWILKWISRIGLLFSVFLFLDFLLPAKAINSRIVDSWFTHGRNQASQSMRIRLEGGHRFSIYPDQSTVFREINTTGVIRVEISPIFGMVLKVVDETNTKSVNVSITHSYLAFIPILMLIVSFTAVVANNRVDAVYNFGSMSLVLMMINAFLLFFVLH